MVSGMDTDDTAAEDPRDGMRKLTDARDLRALAHPLRIALLELVGLNGPITATEAARVIGGTPANAAYHLRTLAKHGYIEEAEGGAGRERPWKIGSVGLSFDDNDSDPTVAHAAAALLDVFTERWFSRVRYYRDHHSEYPDEVRKVSGNSQFVLHGTEAEIEEAMDEIMRIALRFQERLTNPASRPEGSRAYEVIIATHPFDPVTPNATPTATPTPTTSGKDDSDHA
jgi:DNA-binding transcriptional ArsR family regulator